MRFFLIKLSLKYIFRINHAMPSRQSHVTFFSWIMAIYISTLFERNSFFFSEIKKDNVVMKHSIIVTTLLQNNNFCDNVATT